jgi:DNA polymerase-3 subunit chi
MTEVSFYHLQRLPLERALPKLLERTVEAGKRAVVLVRSEERAEALADLLWTYDPAEDANPNGATFLFLADGADSPGLAAYERCFDLFDGNDPEAVQAARARWKSRQEAGHKLRYWQQTDRGGWQEKA